MNKYKITIEYDGRIKTLDVDKLLIMSKKDDKFLLDRYGVEDSDGIGLLKLAEWHMKRDWDKSNE